MLSSFLSSLAVLDHTENLCLTTALSEGAQPAAYLSGCLTGGQTLAVLHVLTLMLDAVHRIFLL